MTNNEILDVHQSLITAMAMMLRAQWLLRTMNDYPKVNGIAIGNQQLSRITSLLDAAQGVIKAQIQTPEVVEPYVDQQLATWGRSPYTKCGAIENTPLDVLIPIVLRRMKEEQYQGPNLQVGKTMAPIVREKPVCAKCEHLTTEPPVCDGQYEPDPCPSFRPKKKLIIEP